MNVEIWLLRSAKSVYYSATPPGMWQPMGWSTRRRPRHTLSAWRPSNSASFATTVMSSSSTTRQTSRRFAEIFGWLLYESFLQVSRKCPKYFTPEKFSTIRREFKLRKVHLKPKYNYTLARTKMNGSLQTKIMNYTLAWTTFSEINMVHLTLRSLRARRKRPLSASVTTPSPARLKVSKKENKVIILPLRVQSTFEAAKMFALIRCFWIWLESTLFSNRKRKRVQVLRKG